MRHAYGALRHLAALVVAAASLALPALRAADSEEVQPLILTEKSDKETISLVKGQELRISLRGQAGTGFTWQVKETPEKLLKPLGEPTEERAKDGPRVGGPVVHTFRFKALAAGAGELELQYRRPFEKDVKPAKAFQLKITVTGVDTWSACRSLLGDWVGEGAGKPGQGSGQFSLALDLDGKVMVRRNHADYPAAGGRPAAKHDDLMVIYQVPGGEVKATYWDNEGHVIQYTVSSSTDGQVLTLLSDIVRGTPRFRLTYRGGKEDTVGIKFEMAPPGQADAFKTYVEGSCRRKK